MSTARVGLSACIITKNEEDRIAQCIRSVSFCDEVIVVDSNSTDGTQQIARDLGATVIVRDWPGYGLQKEFAVRAATYDWVLCLDADEHASAPLQQEIMQARDYAFAESVGYTMPRLTMFEGAWIRHGTWYPDRSVRLFNRKHGHWSANRVHEQVLLDANPAMLMHDLLHDGYRSQAEHLAKMDVYTTLMAEELAGKGLKANVIDVWMRPLVAFIKAYVFKLGFLDGVRGLRIAYFGGLYTHKKYAKLMSLASSAD